jgi:prepilin-type N-terminal cleavage/methylation domain-containing protein/prepilin-type processing-associated H-X9-DG protein
MIQPRCRRGFTLVELLVVIAIIGILVALLLPAINAARESARRSECQNNLKQIGLALQTFHTNHSKLPPGWDRLKPWAWSSKILPQLEQGPLYDQIKVFFPTDGPGDGGDDNVAPCLTQLKAFQCPSDGNPKNTWLEMWLDGAKVYHVASNYPAVAGDVTMLGSEPWPGEVFADDEAPVRPRALHGAFGCHDSVKLDDFKDGTSQTIIVGERRRLPTATEFNSPGLKWAKFPTGTIGGATHWVGNASRQSGICYAQSVGVTYVPINTPDDQQAFSSTHSGGATFVFGDGHVKFLSETVDIVPYKALSTIAGKEAIAGEIYE